MNCCLYFVLVFAPVLGVKIGEKSSYVAEHLAFELSKTIQCRVVHSKR
jgi:hypothetical protein